MFLSTRSIKQFLSAKKDALKIIGIVLMFVLGIGGFLVGNIIAAQKSQEAWENRPQPSPTVSASPSPEQSSKFGEIIIPSQPSPVLKPKTSPKPSAFPSYSPSPAASASPSPVPSPSPSPLPSPTPSPSASPTPTPEATASASSN